MWRFLVDLKEFTPGPWFAWGEAAKGEAVYGQAGENECHHKCCGAGDHGYFDALGNGAPYQCEARVGDSRGASISNEGDRFSLFQHVFDLLACSLLVVFVKRDLRFGDVEVFEQQAGFARVFAGDDVDFT